MTAKRYRFNPSLKTKTTLLNDAFSAARWMYNESIRQTAEPANRKKKPLRTAIENKISTVVPEFRKRLREVPYDIRDRALCEALTSVKTNLKKNTRFAMKFRHKKKMDREVIFIRPRDLVRTRGKYAELNADLRKIDGLDLDTIEHEIQLVRTQGGRYYVVIPTSHDHEAYGNENQVLSEPIKIVSCDPGVRTFCTAYDPHAEQLLYWGCPESDNHPTKVQRLLSCIDAIKAKMDVEQINTGPKARRRRVHQRQLLHRIETNIHNSVSDLHHKLAKYLCREYNVILWPTFETSKMARKTGSRCLPNKVVRRLMRWRHYGFKQVLLHKARTHHRDVRVLFVSEAYTTQTCGCCGSLYKPGGSEEYDCPTCGVKMDRDGNAARNILLRWLASRSFPATETCETSKQKDVSL